MEAILNEEDYVGIEPVPVLSLPRIFSIHYFEYMRDFFFPGESHDFWEFICVDKGEVGITYGENYRVLKKGDVHFHEPNEFHNVKVFSDHVPNLVVISFGCTDYAMNFFKRKTLRIENHERNLLAQIISEARACFDCRLDDPYLKNMPLRKNMPVGGLQLIQGYLVQFLIHLLRRHQNPLIQSLYDSSAPTLQILKLGKNDSAIFMRVNTYLEEHINRRITVAQICKDNLVGRSHLEKIMRNQTGYGVMEYFTARKISAAKELIRSDRMNFSQIAEYLGFSSIHYFSRVFKIKAGMTPSEYSSSIKALTEHAR